MKPRLKIPLWAIAVFLILPFAAKAVERESFVGQVVVSSTGDRSIIVALDTTGGGQSDQVFAVATRTSIERLSLHSGSARVEVSDTSLLVTMPDEGKVLVFSTRNPVREPYVRLREIGEESSSVPEPSRVQEGDVQVVNNVASLIHLDSARYRFELADLQSGKVPGGLRSLVAGDGKVIPQNQYPPGVGGTGGCLATCSVSCGLNGASKCSASCDLLSCAECTCGNLGASCSCRSYLF